MNLSGTSAIPAVGFQYVQDHPDSGLRTVKAVDAKNISTPVNFTLEDRHNASLKLGETGWASELAVLFAEQMPRNRVTAPHNESHGIHYQRESPQRYSFAARFLGPHSFRDMEIPTEDQPKVLINATLDQAAPFELYVDDDVRNFFANVSVDQLGGGLVHADGLFAFGDKTKDPRAHLNLTLPTPPEEARVHVVNQTTWIQGTLTTQATRVNAIFHLPEIKLDGNQPMTLDLHSAPTEQSAPAPETGEPVRYAIIDKTGALPLVGIDVTGITGFHLRPGGTGNTSWDAATTQDLLIRFVNQTTNLHRLYIDDLPTQGAAWWNATQAGFDGHLEIPAGATIPRIEVNLTQRDPKANTTTTGQQAEKTAPTDHTLILATIQGITGPGEFDFQPDERAYLDVPGGIGEFHGQVLTGATGDQRLPQLDNQLGVLFEQPVGGSITYESAFVAHLKNPELLDATLEQPPVPEGTAEEDAPGGLKVNGTLVLKQALEKDLWFRVNTPGAFVNASVENLPVTTNFHIDTRQVPEGEPELPLVIELDWPVGQVENMTGEFRTYQERDGEARELDLNGNFTLLGAKNVTLRKQGALDDVLDMRFGGLLDNAVVRVDQGENRTWIRSQGLQGTYDAQVLNKGEAGHATLIDGDPADSLSLEYKAQDADRRIGTAPQFLLAHKDTNGTEIEYIHARLHGVRHVTWDANETQGTALNATLKVEPSIHPAYIEYLNTTQEVTAILQELPEETTFTFADQENTTRIDVEVSSSVNVPELTYKTLADPGWGVVDRSGRMTNTSLVMQLARADDLNLALTSFGDRGDNVTLTTAGIGHARLFGVLRGEQDAPNRAKHVFVDLDGVPATTLSFQHENVTRESDNETARKVTYHSTDLPPYRVAASFTDPVRFDLQNLPWPDPGHSELVNVEDSFNQTHDTMQRVVQLNLTLPDQLSFDPATPPGGCAACKPLHVTLSRAVDGFPLFINVNNASLAGWIDAASAPKELSLDLGMAKTKVTTEDGGTEDKLQRLVAGYSASGPLKDTEVDLTFDPEQEPVKVTGDAGEIPSQATMSYYRDPTPQPVTQRACGFTWEEIRPASFQLTAGAPGEAFQGVNLALGQWGTSNQPAPGKDFLGLELEGDNPHARLILSRVEHLDVEANWTEGLSAHADLGHARDLRVQFTADNGTGQEDDDKAVNVTLGGAAWPITATCGENTINATAPSTGNIGNIFVEGSGVNFLNHRATGFAIQALGTTGGFHLETTPEDASERIFEVNKTQPDSKISALIADVTLEPPNATEVEACQETLDTRPLHVSWGIPVGAASFWMTTKAQQEDLPDGEVYPLRTRVVGTCEETTFIGAVQGLESFWLDKSCDWTRLSLDQEDQLKGAFEVAGRGCTEGEVPKYKKFTLDKVPTSLWLKTNIDGKLDLAGCYATQSFHNVLDDCLLLENREAIEHFEYTSTAAGMPCVYARADQIPAGGPSGLLFPQWQSAFVGGGVASGVSCGVQAVAGTIQTIGEGFGKLYYKASNGVDQAIELYTTTLEGALELVWDADGVEEQRDRIRFTKIAAKAENLKINATASNGSKDRGTLIDFTKASRPGENLDIDIGSRWWAGPSSRDENLTGTLDLPDSMTERRCLDWNYTTDPKSCDRYETWEDVLNRVTPQLREVARFVDGEWYQVTPEQWKEVVS